MVEEEDKEDDDDGLSHDPVERGEPDVRVNKLRSLDVVMLYFVLVLDL